jgi:hypothetical protein
MTPASRRRANTRLAWRGSIAPQLGKQDNCQVAVTLSLATWEASLPVAWRLYLPRERAKDWALAPRAVAGCPLDQPFQTRLAGGKRKSRIDAGRCLQVVDKFRMFLRDTPLPSPCRGSAADHGPAGRIPSRSRRQSRPGPLAPELGVLERSGSTTPREVTVRPRTGQGRNSVIEQIQNFYRVVARIPAIMSQAGSRDRPPRAGSL